MGIYLDYNSSTPLDPNVLHSMIPYFYENCGNPSNINSEYGMIAKKAIENSIDKILNYINASGGDVIFTSGATESNNLALMGLLRGLKGKNKHIITSRIEHSSILEVCQQLEKSLEVRVSYIDVSEEGVVDISQLEGAIEEDTVLISIMGANNEVGTIQPIIEIGKIAKKYGVLFHSDMTQGILSMDVDVNDMGIDMMTISGHKICGPKGIGALYLGGRCLNILEKQTFGGNQQCNLRAGTLNVPGIVGIGSAIELLDKNKSLERKRINNFRDILFKLIKNGIPGVKINGSIDSRLDNNLNITLPEITSFLLLSEVHSLSFSTASACSSEVGEASHVLKAMGHSSEYISRTIRISIGRFTTMEEVNEAGRIIVEAYNKLKTNRGG